MQINLPPELETILEEYARRRGITSERVVEDVLREQFGMSSEVETTGKTTTTLAERLGDFVGSLQSSEYVPGGAQLSDKTSTRFAQGMVRKRKEGRL